MLRDAIHNRTRRYVSRNPSLLLLGTYQQFVTRLSAPVMETRRHALWALARFGPRACAAIPVLIHTMRTDKSEWVQKAAAEALGGICSEVTPPSICRAVRGPVGDFVEGDTVVVAPRHVKRIRAWRSHVIDALLQMLVEGGDVTARGGVYTALQSIGPDAKAALPKLRELQQKGVDWWKDCNDTIKAIEGKQSA